MFIAWSGPATSSTSVSPFKLLDNHLLFIIYYLLFIIIIILISKNAIDLENSFFCFLIEMNCFNWNEMFLIWIIFV